MNTYCVIGLGWPCLTQNEWAAWVQAVGSLIAIAVAIAVPAAQHALAVRRARQESDAVAMAKWIVLVDPLMDLHTGLVEIRTKQRHPEISPLTDPDLIPILRLPPGIIDLAGQTHRLGTVARQIESILLLSKIVREMLETMPILKMAGEWPANQERQMLDVLARIEGDAKKAIDTIGQALERTHGRIALK